jgi:hypothetical protein
MGQSCSEADLAARILLTTAKKKPVESQHIKDAGQSFHRTEQPPLVRQHQITVTQRGVGVGGSEEVER